MLAWLFWCNIVCGQKCGQKREHKTGHNSSSWPPFEIKSSALDRIFHAGSNGNSFKAWNVQNNDEKVGPESEITTKKVGPDKKKSAPKKWKKYTMFWPFRTTGHSRFGWGSHRRWSPTRLKKMSYGQKTVLAREKFYQNRHNSGSRPSPGMIPVTKWIILSRGIFLKPQNSLGRPGDPKNDCRKNWKMQKSAKKLKMLFLRKTHKPLSFDNFIHLTGRWQYLYTKNQPCSSFGGRAMNSGVPKNDNFRLLGVGDGYPLLIP